MNFDDGILPDKALEVWDTMKEKGVLPNIVTYNSIIGGLYVITCISYENVHVIYTLVHGLNVQMHKSEIE